MPVRGGARAAAPRLAQRRGMAAMDVDAAAAPPLRTRQVTRDVACPTTYFRLRMCVLCLAWLTQHGSDASLYARAGAAHVA